MIRYKKLPDDILQKINPLTVFFKKDSNIVFAYLFGGLLKKRRSPLSDIDIAVYLKDTGKSDYLELFGKISGHLNTDEVDLGKKWGQTCLLTFALNPSINLLTSVSLYEKAASAKIYKFLDTG